MKLYGFLKRFMAWLAIVCCEKIWRYESSRGHVGLRAALCCNGCGGTCSWSYGASSQSCWSWVHPRGIPARPGLPQGCYVTLPWVSFVCAISTSEIWACALASAANWMLAPCCVQCQVTSLRLGWVLAAFFFSTWGTALSKAWHARCFMDEAGVLTVATRLVSQGRAAASAAVLPRGQD